MDELLDKFLKDEVTPEQFDTELNKLSPEEKVKFDEKLATPEVRAQLTAKGKEAVEALKGLRKAAKVIGDGAKPDLSANLRKENVAKASKRFFEEFKIPADEQATYLSSLEQSSSDTVSEDLLYAGLGRIYASTHANELLEGKKKLDTMKQNGEEYNAAHAGAAGSGDHNPEGKPRDPKVLEWMADAAKKGVPFASYEAAERALNEGTRRTISG